MYTGERDKRFYFLCNEATLTEWTIYNGLTNLQNSSFTYKGKTYIGFLNLSIGIERLCKLIIITDFMLKNNFKPPSYNKIKRLSHDLIYIIEEVYKLSENYNNKIKTINKNTILYKTIYFLSKFAKSSRYENIDNLCSNNMPEKSHMDEWEEILKFIIETKISRKKIEQEKNISINLYNDLKNMAYFDISSYGNYTLKENMFSNFKLQEKAISLLIRDLLYFICSLTDLLYEITDRQYNQSKYINNPIFPYMRDFFKGLYIENKNTVLKKKRWQYP